MLRYNGAKWILAPWIVSHFPEHRVYVDLFGGSGSVLLRKPRSVHEYFNDLDGDVTSFFRQLRDHPKELLRAIRWTAYGRAEHGACAANGDVSELEKARRFFVRCWQDRANNRGPSSFRSVGNVRTEEGGFVPQKMWADLRPVYEAAMRFKGVVVENKNALELAPTLDTEKTLFYVDPPYLGATRKDSQLYNHELMGEEEHNALLSLLGSLSGMVVLSGYRHDLYDSLGWHRVDKETVNDKRQSRTESLYFNDAAWSNQRQQDLFGGIA